MHTMHMLAFFAAAADAAAQAGQWGRIVEPAKFGAVMARDGGCSEIPKLCTDRVLLSCHETTLTYLCPETEVPSTVTITTTATTTVIDNAGPTASGFVLSVSAPNVPTPTSAERTTTTTVHSTMLITATETVVEATASPSFPLTPATITWSFPVLRPSEVESAWSAFKNVSSRVPHLPQHQPVTTKTSEFTELTSLNIFPTHTVKASSTASLTKVLSSAALSKPPYTNATSSHSGHSFPTLNVMREAKSTETVTTTAAVATTTGTGMASESRVSLVALFLSVMATALMF